MEGQASGGGWNVLPEDDFAVGGHALALERGVGLFTADGTLRKAAVSKGISLPA